MDMTLPGFNAYLPAWANQNRAFRQIISTVTWYCTIVMPSPNKVTVCHSLQLVPQQRNTQYAARKNVLQYLFQSRTAPVVLCWQNPITVGSDHRHKIQRTPTAFFYSRDQLDINLETLLLIREELNRKLSHNNSSAQFSLVSHQQLTE